MKLSKLKHAMKRSVKFTQTLLMINRAMKVNIEL